MSAFHLRRRKRGASTALRIVGVVVLVLLVALLAVLSITDWNFARDRIAAFASARLNRDVKIENLSAHLLSFHPTVRVEGLTIGNPDWAADNDMAKDMASVERLLATFNIGQLFLGHVMFDTLEIDNPRVAILSDEQGRYNFEFSETPDKDKEKNEKREPPKLPGVRQFSVRGGDLYVSDVVHKLTFKGSVDANEDNQHPDQIPFRLHGEGSLNGEPFNLVFQGGPLANIKMDRPYEFDADIRAGKTHATAQGKFERPFDVARVTTELKVEGDNLAHLYYLTNLALPFTPPYRVAGQLKTSQDAVTLHNLDGVVGKSDMSGDVSIKLRTKKDPPKLTAKLHSTALNLPDLSPAFGKGVSKDSEAPKPAESDKLFPTYEFEFDRLRKMDADVVIDADSVKTQKVPFTGVEFHITLNDAVLKFDPVVFSLPLGKIAGTVNIDARESPAATKLDLRISNVKLDEFKGKNSENAPLAGTLLARLQLTGKGNSVHDFAASSNGKVTAVVPHGEIRQALAELLGINVARGLGLLLSKDEQKSTVRCGVATLDVKKGNASVDQMVFDTDTVLIKGDGNIDLDTEALNIDIKGQPKKARALRVRSPVEVNGTLRKPSIGLNAGDTVKQAGVAAALGAIFAPLAAAIAFIDPGLAKDQNCAALLADAKKSAPAPLPKEQQPERQSSAQQTPKKEKS